jgi:septal ring factor EnvC (AmiA/AmiB activator)
LDEEYVLTNFKPIPKRKELQAQLDTASAELESMHTERAALQAIIDEQEKEIDELRRENLQLTLWQRLYEWGKA